MECLVISQRFHRGFTAAEKTELWDRWQRGESLKAIGRPIADVSLRRSEPPLRADFVAEVGDFGREVAQRSGPHNVPGGNGTLSNRRRALITQGMHQLLAAVEQRALRAGGGSVQLRPV
jgi:hypothetical protein